MTGDFDLEAGQLCLLVRLERAAQVNGRIVSVVEPDYPPEEDADPAEGPWVLVSSSWISEMFGADAVVSRKCLLPLTLPAPTNVDEVHARSDAAC